MFIYIYNLNLSEMSPTILMPSLFKRFSDFGGPLHHRPAEDLAFAVARFIQKGGSFVNYYMVGFRSYFSKNIYDGNRILFNLSYMFYNVEQYHGGTNFGRTAGGPFITTSYDYDAPVDEYGEKKSYL